MAFTTLTGTIPLPRSQVYRRMSDPIFHRHDKMERPPGGVGSGVRHRQHGDEPLTRFSDLPARSVTRVSGNGSVGTSGNSPRSIVPTMARSVRVLLLPPFPTRSQPGRRQRRSAISQWQTKGRADCLCASSRRPYKQSPPIIGGGQRNRWLDVAPILPRCPSRQLPSIRSVATSVRSLRASLTRTVWDTLRPPSPGSYKSLLSQAEHADQSLVATSLLARCTIGDAVKRPD